MKVIRIATTTSWLECCLRDLMGDGIEIVRLCPPGQCPGHFDMKPSAFKALQDCQALLRFDFQAALDGKLAQITGDRLRIISIDSPEGLCLPGGYRDGLRQTHAALTDLYPKLKIDLDKALISSESRLTTLEQELQRTMNGSGLPTTGLKVAASGHQSAFCRWLGLDPVVTYSGANATDPAQIENIIAQGRKAGIRLVITNRQEGRQIGEALAWQLEAKEVTFSNFPRMADGEQTFDDLLRNNVAALAETLCEPAS